MVFCGKHAVSDQSHISTQDTLPTGPLYPFLVRPATANHHGEMILLSFYGHKNMFRLPFRKGGFLSHSWFLVIISSPEQARKK